MRILIVLALVAIIASLASGFYYMLTDRGQSERAVRALTIRVGLSLTLFLLLLAAQALGWLPARHF